MTRYQIPGEEKKLTEHPILEPLEDSDFELIQVIEVSKTRATGKIIDLKTEEEDYLVDVLFDDGTEWIGSALDFKEIFPEEDLVVSRGSNAIMLPTGISDPENRGLGTFLRAINIFRFKKKGKKGGIVGRKLGEWIDNKLVSSPGLFRINRQFELSPFSITADTTHEYFLFIHGTISNTHNSFHKLKDFDTTGAWQTIHDQFGNNVLTLEHFTVSQSPLKNALDVIKALPSGAKITVMSGSRGGLIGDILAKCDNKNPNPGFSPLEINALEAIDPAEADLANQINELIGKDISIHKNIRVACPGAGTKILSGRADHFLNGILGVIGLAFGGPANQIYQFVRRFIMKVIRSRTTPGVMPGLLAMVPGSYLVQILNHPQNAASDHLYIIEGNAKFGKLGRSLLVILARLYFLKKNDFVVNTDSMRRGIRRSGGLYWLRSEDKHTHHLNYFKNPVTQKAIKVVMESAVGTTPDGFRYSGPADERGVVARFFNLKEESRQKISGKKPIIVLLPGIMGSHLFSPDDRIWIDFESIIKGKIKSHLKISDSIKAHSIVGNYYTKLVDFLTDKYDVYCFPYDWRKSLTIAAEQLAMVLDNLSKYDQKIKIIAHSMGGIVVRTMMTNHKMKWNAYIQKEESQVILLGTPWYGSYLILEVLTGMSNRVAQLALLDLKNSRRQLMEVFLKYPGIYELLPIEEKRSFERIEIWQKLNQELPYLPKPGKNMLRFFQTLKSEVNNTHFNLEKFIYIAGKSETTTFDYRIKESLFGKKIQFLQTPKGDGSVTWDGGIPEELPVKNLYYTPTEHGQLANDPTLFQGISELLMNRHTFRFSQTPPSTRGKRITIAQDPAATISNDPNSIVDVLFGIATAEAEEKPEIEIEVTLSHGDLKYGKFPIMVGHFDQDGIVSAEFALDRYLGGKLKERHALGKYPGRIKESEIIIQPETQPKGALVVGLGDIANMTAFRLSQTVELGILSYAMLLRDQGKNQNLKMNKNGITSLLIGSGYGRLPLDDSLSAILKGVDRANQTILNTNSNLEPIIKVEFIELYEHVTRKAYYSLKKIQRDESQLKIHFVEKINPGNGARKRLEYRNDDIWWDIISSEYKEVASGCDKKKILEYTLSSGLARIQKQAIYPSEAIVTNLLDGFSPKTSWQKERAKTLFEILIPRDFKSVIRNQNNIIWKVDRTTANYPWEMFHDYKMDEIPTFVNAGLIRQLVGENYRPNPRIIRSQTALVIGDPKYIDMPEFGQLPGALREATFVNNLLKKAEYKVKFYPNSDGETILDGLFNNEYKILHISGHGVYDPENNAVGPVLGKNMYLHSGILKNLDNVPEFVFINCCYSGEVRTEASLKDRYKFAANVGTTLIEMGVHAAVIAGWEVNDIAAELFANELYSLMLNGYNFGKAVQKARQKCYEAFPTNNTWGAYQCYGNQWYTFDTRFKSDEEEEEYIAYEEVEVDLYNLRVQTDQRKSKSGLLNWLQYVMDKAHRSGMINGQILEMEAGIYAGLDEIGIAVDKYISLLKLNDANYSVKALEQYCNMRVKLLVQKPGLTLSEINDCLSEIEALCMISNSPERLAIWGSAYKKFALVKKRKKEAYLQSMFEKYARAYENAAGDLSYELYPLFNLLIADYLLDNRRVRQLNGVPIDAQALLRDAKKVLRIAYDTLSDFTIKCFTVNLMLVEILISEKNEMMEEIGKEIESLYQEIWNLGGNFQYLRTEIDHLRFLMEIDTRKVSAKKRDVYQSLVELLISWSDSSE